MNSQVLYNYGRSAARKKGIHESLFYLVSSLLIYPDRSGEYAVSFRGAGHEGISTFGDLSIYSAGVVYFFLPFLLIRVSFYDRRSQP